MKIASISTYLPRECGIATFNNNVERAIQANFQNQIPSGRGFGIAVNDSEDLQTYAYPSHVKFVIRQNQQKDYIQAANFINTSDVHAVILEHEFGIYGGESGVYILPMLHRLEKPLFSILHTVLKEPSHIQKLIIQEIAQRSAKVIVMSHRGMEFLTDIYNITPEKIQYIEHGVPDLERPIVNPLKKVLPFRKYRILLTFGLLSRNKGLETVIKALPKLVEHHPDVMYVVLGKTHPGVLRTSGEEYRDHLKRLAIRLKVEKHLTFINKFVSEAELMNYLTAAEIYVTPYLNEAQITSGTLSYAVGAGSAIVSTPYWHALELLADQRGALFPFKDVDMLSRIVNELLEQPDKLELLRRNAYDYGLHLRWPKIGADYIRMMNTVIEQEAFAEKTLHQIIDPEIMPEFSLNHVSRLTDDTGIVQHAKYGIPNLKEGYCLDDNARALIMALMAYQRNKSQEALDLLPIYLSFIHYMQGDDGNFRNFLSFKREYLDEVGSEDSFGRTVWALGYLVSCAPNNSYREFAGELFHRSVPHFSQLHHLRGVANTIIGISYYLKAHPEDEVLVRELIDLTTPLMQAYQKHRGKDWHWFEEKLTYDNAILPLALLHAYEITGDENVKKVAMESLAFLDKLSLKNGFLSPVGNHGWFNRGGSVPVFDQQAIETMAMVLMYLQAYQSTHLPIYIEKMFVSYQWFLGENILRVPLYDHETKGCCDGLQETALNRNQGAESTLAYLISHLAVLKALEFEYEYNPASQDLEPA
ncbi:glycosyltransferase involved in cell wall biosynthesis [Catalinimonas alkaloidigena]|uniref:glycosyltransferase family 4 protein n=1 Tax=Catalinimonas alkaloidigena TaxID=1075417 RepID=UPI002404FCED|nr:glycosyltransferase [Catalinimonas alkaloidigena]MDF9796308.1 glycosyltransferase involved in cell wall biosynthesis [Catalinimonas alkaloidigena]